MRNTTLTRVLQLAVVLSVSLPLFIASPASATHARIVRIDATLEHETGGIFFEVRVRAHGPATMLSGSGEIQSGTATFHFEVTGSAVAGVVELSGIITASSEPGFIGIPIQIVAEDASGVVFVESFNALGTGEVSVLEVPGP